VKLALLGLAAAGVLLLFASGERNRDPRAMTPAEAGTARIGPPARVRPAPPSRYRVPLAAVRVDSASGLHAALAVRRRRSIVLAPGVYGGSRPFLNPHGHHLYASRLGGSVLRAGLSLGGNGGPGGGSVRGLVVDVGDRSRTVDGAAIAVWGSGRRSQILDTTLRGRATLPAGVSARRPDGLRIQRLVVRGFTDFGVLVDANDPTRTAPREPFSIADVDVAGVSRRSPGSSDGKAEACVWIGDTGTVRRVRARSCASTGLWTGTATRGALFEAIEVDDAPTGVYVEHFTRDSRFRRLRIGPRVRVGLLAEWASPEWGGRPASIGNVIEDSHFDSRIAGVYLDEGSTRTTVRRSTFANQEWAAIGDYRGVGNAFYDNDYSGIAPGAQTVSQDHVTASWEG
jgi:hypothetical protein